MKETNPALAARRKFLSKLGRAVTYAGAVVGAGTLVTPQHTAAKSESVRDKEELKKKKEIPAMV